MKKEVRFLNTEGNITTNEEFVLGYKKMILFALQKKELLSQVEYETCLEKLEKMMQISSKRNAENRNDIFEALEITQKIP